MVDSATAASQYIACKLSVHHSTNVPHNDLAPQRFYYRRLDYNVRKANLKQVILKLTFKTCRIFKNIIIYPCALFRNKQYHDAPFCDAGVAGSTIVTAPDMNRGEESGE
jgi:hypothetical protein